jgi:hypothetical protein
MVRTHMFCLHPLNSGILFGTAEGKGVTLGVCECR